MKTTLIALSACAAWAAACAKAFTYFKRACELAGTDPDEFIACQMAANLAAFQLDEPTEAETLATRGCDHRYGGACYALGTFYVNEDSGLPTDAEKALTLIAKACDYDYDEACQLLAKL